MKRGYFIKMILVFYFFHVCLSIQPVTDSEKEVFYLSEIKEDDEIDIITEGEIMSGSLFGSVKKYYCKVNISEEESDFLLYGSKFWTFPLQDVTLNLEYPSKKHKNKTIADVDYVITEFRVTLYLDAVSSKGYITHGGLLQEEISMRFVFSNITSLAYQFYLYGISENSTNNIDISKIGVNLC